MKFTLRLINKRNIRSSCDLRELFTFSRSFAEVWSLSLQCWIDLTISWLSNDSASLITQYIYALMAFLPSNHFIIDLMNNWRRKYLASGMNLIWTGINVWVIAKGRIRANYSCAFELWRGRWAQARILLFVTQISLSNNLLPLWL